MTPDQAKMTFEVGMAVRKTSGDYSFPSVVIGVVTKLGGNVLLVCECTAEETKGMVHVFAPSQMEPIDE